MKTLEQLAQHCTINVINSDIRIPAELETQRSMESIIYAALKEAQALVYESMKKAASPVKENEKEDEFYRRAEEEGE